MISCLHKIIQVENLAALYKGNGAQMVRIFPYAATQFTSYEFYKTIFGNLVGHKTHFYSFLSGSAAGITAVFFTYPLDTIRARLAFQVKGEHIYSGITHAAVTMCKEVSNYEASLYTHGNGTSYVYIIGRWSQSTLSGICT